MKFFMLVPDESSDPVAKAKGGGKASFSSCEHGALLGLHTNLGELLTAKASSPTTETRCRYEKYYTDDD